MRTDVGTTDGQTDGRTNTRTANVKTQYPATNVWRGINIPFLEQDLIFLHSKTCGFIFELNSYHVTAFPSLNHSLLDA